MTARRQPTLCCHSVRSLCWLSGRSRKSTAPRRTPSSTAGRLGEAAGAGRQVAPGGDSVRGLRGSRACAGVGRACRRAATQRACTEQRSWLARGLLHAQRTCHEHHGGMHRGGLLEERGRLLRGQRRQQPVLQQHAVKRHGTSRKARLRRLHAVHTCHCGHRVAAQFVSGHHCWRGPSGGLAAAARSVNGQLRPSGAPPRLHSQQAAPQQGLERQGRPRSRRAFSCLHTAAASGTPGRDLEPCAHRPPGAPSSPAKSSGGGAGEW